MAWFKRSDPITERGRALNDEIARLEAEIQSLSKKIDQKPEGPRLRPAAVPAGDIPVPASPAPAPPPPAALPATTMRDPIFEDVDVERLASNEAAPTPDQFNELGVRKYDLPALLRRIRNHLRGPTTTNPKLVSYLAAGGIQGLRPLRYEKRVARNRFIVLVAGLFLVLLGLILVFVRTNM